MKRLRRVNLVVVLTLLTGWLAWLPTPVQAAPAAFDCGDVTEIPQTECEALVALYESTDGDNWDDNTGWLTTDTPCDWYGVTCEAEHVAELTLYWNNLSGALPSEIGDLSALTELKLGGNHLTSLPPEIDNLTALRYLTFAINDLTTLPSEIGNLSALEYLSLSYNDLSSLPKELWNLTTLTELWLFDVNLTSLPPEVENLTALKELWLDYNNLTALPAEIKNLTALHTLSLRHNKLTTLPVEIGSLIALTSLYLQDNDIATLPTEFQNLTKLVVLELHENALMTLPTEIGNFTSLKYLYLNTNPLSGEIPSSMTQLQQLTRFTFYDTEWCVPLTGDVPTWLGGIPDLWGTGLICGEDLGSLSGAVTLTDTMPAADVQVNLYRSTSWPRWQHLTTTHTTANGTYQFTGLGQGLGIDYRVQFVDPTHQLAPQYYDAKPTIDTATVITITPGTPRTGIDA
ncbi:MAG: hypothetical protein GVY30_01485, partial [Chloroflexi bacterium]|nr:hypothetical protein [Chloroflexota bacterium]